MGTSVPVTVTATVSASAVLNAWIDFNRDGDWDDAGEHVFIDEPISNGINSSFTIDVPSGASVGTTFVRFRLTATGGYSYVGLAPNGEVEDYLLSITAPQPPLALLPEPQSSEPAPAVPLIEQLFFTLSLPGTPLMSFLNGSMQSDKEPAELSLFTTIAQPTVPLFSVKGPAAAMSPFSTSLSGLVGHPGAPNDASGSPAEKRFGKGLLKSLFRKKESLN